MPVLRILFTAAGGEPTRAALSALRTDDHQAQFFCIGTDVDDWKRSYLSLDEFHLAPLRSSPDYIPFLLNLCKQRRVDLIWPNPTEEQMVLEPFLNEFESIGIRVLAPPGSAVRLFANKAKTYRHAAACGVRYPEFHMVSSIEEVERHAHNFGYPKRPVIFRRVEGRGGMGMRVLQEGPALSHELFEALGGGRLMTLTALHEVLREASVWPECMIAEYLPGLEFDVDCLCDGEGVVQAVVRRNDLIWGGTSMLAEVVDRPDLVEVSRKLLESVHWRYICSVSFREDSKGYPTLMEINPRLPSSINLTWKAGYNMPLAAIKMCMGEIAPPQGPIRFGTKIIRFLDEAFVMPS